jgi:hypothetical protein
VARGESGFRRLTGMNQPARILAWANRAPAIIFTESRVGQRAS